jgi:hypothetical protein
LIDATSRRRGRLSGFCRFLPFCLRRRCVSGRFWAGGRARRRLDELEHIRSSLTQDLGRVPSRSELAAELAKAITHSNIVIDVPKIEPLPDYPLAIEDRNDSPEGPMIDAELLRRMDLLRRELAIRNRLEAEFYPARQSDRTEASSRADLKYEQAKADVRQKLIGVGYVDGRMPDGTFDSITSDRIGRHPAVFAARNERDAALATRESRGDERLNAREIQKLQQAFEQMKQRAMSAVA